MAKRKTAGDLLRRWIEDQRQTQVSVASALGVNQSTLNDILSGRRQPSLTLAARIEDLTGIRARDFAGVA